ncbi:unnamed protein product [Symbiodinium microadriaticum]|nr:unnamed protein product [Symbiodinium microadriaticum]CAE7302447.1 unnamed protein product [Symbiodinium sp. KB8]
MQRLCSKLFGDGEGASIRLPMAFSSFGTWFARLCNCKRPLHEAAAYTPKKCVPDTTGNPRCQATKPSQVQEAVYIDKMTTVPADLYKKMVVAGSRARARGQHSLKAKPRTSDPKQASRTFEPSLVRNKSYYG